MLLQSMVGVGGLRRYVDASRCVKGISIHVGDTSRTTLLTHTAAKDTNELQ